MQKIDMIRLVADDGKELVNGNMKATCVDTFPDKIEEWSEVEKAEESETSGDNQ